MKPSWGRNRSLFYRGWGHSFLVCGRSLGWMLNLFQAVPCWFFKDFCAMWCIHTADLWMRAHAWDWERTAVLRELFNIRFSYKHCNFSHFCLLVNMASKTVTRSIQPCFLRGGSERLACSEPTDATRFLKELEVHSVHYGQGKNVFKREFSCLWKVYGRFLHFDISVEEKPQNVHLKLIFCHVLSRFNLRERIQDPVNVIR